MAFRPLLIDSKFSAEYQRQFLYRTFFDVAEALPELCGDHYVGHGEHSKLHELTLLNEFDPKDLLTGEQESRAFVNKEFVMLHQSTLRKVRLIHALARRAWDGTLKTEASFWQRHGANAWGLIDDLMEHPAYKRILFVFAIIGFGATLKSILDAL